MRPTTPPNLGESALASTNKLEKISVPQGTLSAYHNADGWKDYKGKMEESQ